MFRCVIVCLFTGIFIYDPTLFEVDIVILLCGVLLVNLLFCHYSIFKSTGTDTTQPINPFHLC
jgi:hypothetical protein